MSVTSDPGQETAQREFVITRLFDAPPQRLFKAWTEPRHMARWWGPSGFTNPICEMDVRTGGAWRIVMQSPDGVQHPAKGVYREINPPRRIVLTINHAELPEEWHDRLNPQRDKSKPRPALEALVTAMFEEFQGKTRLTIRVKFESAAVRDAFVNIGMNQGWSQSLDRLAAELPHVQSSPENRQTPKGNTMQVLPYLHFDGQCQEAIEFYQKTLGAEMVTVMRYKECPEPPPPGAHMPDGDKIMHARLRIGDTTLLASDGGCQGPHSFQGFSLTLTAANETEAKKRFAALSDGGTVRMPLAKTFFSPQFGMLADRFGVSWMVYVEPPAGG